MAGPKRVLYVEDNQANFSLVRKVLESNGEYAVERADSAEEGLIRLQDERPDLILLDLDLPGMGGIELARQIKGDPELSSIPLVAISASVMKRERVEALDAGCVAFVEKPFDIHDLRSIVREAIVNATNQVD